ncbi:hypothetical protein Sjap_017244 [Stephania japonica]|uniref:EF-hand domain-containing protein n=1 Tax=Stephania japonica TaxID=461633 RepID=A0AAP0I5S7_9MAGN
MESKKEMTLEEFKEWLIQFDDDGDKRISRDELRDALQTLGEWFTSWKSKQGLESADLNCNGVIDENELNYLVVFAKQTLDFNIVVYN